MKLKVFTVIMIVILAILFSSNVYAATGTVNFVPSTNQVKKGDTFTVTLSASSEDGINGVETKYTYNSEKLEFVSGNVVNSSNWISMGTAPEITIICNSQEKIKNADLYTLTFKVKDSANVGDTIKVETNEILLDTDAQENSEVNIGAKKAEVTVIESSSEKPKDEEPAKQDEQGKKDEEPAKQDVPAKQEEPTKQDEPTKQGEPAKQDEPTTPENTDKKTETGTNTEQQAKQEESGKNANGSANQEEQAKQTDSSPKTEEKQINNSSINENQIKTISASQSEDKANPSKLPKTGINYITIGIAICILSISAILFYRKYNYIKLIK